MDAGRDLWDAQPGYFNTASYGLPPRSAVEALEAVLDDWRRGRTSWEPWDAVVPEARASFARLAGVPVSDVAIGAAVSEQIGLVAASLPNGARVVVPEGEYTSNLFPWLVQGDRGVEVTCVPLAEVAEAIDARTTLVAFSLVQSSSGVVAPVEQIVAAARHHGALVAVDGTQACGWLPVDASRFDAYAVHAYKWLMSPRGAAFVALSPRMRELLRPIAAGWYAGEEPYASFYGTPMQLAADARRFDTSPAWFSWIGTKAALDVVEQIGVAVIHEHNVTLANRLRTGLGLEPGESAIVSADIPDAERRLEHAGIRASVRAGRIRLSCHVYTTERDIDDALTALA
jgi:selenocysteine lyase/cysteine desulfurase